MSPTTILIVEDESIVAADLEGKLRRGGYSVVGIASSGEEAISIVNNQSPRLILMDIELQGPLDGIETTRRIQAQHDVPVVYLTAHSDQATLSRAKLTGPLGYVLKPFDERDLATQIEIALHKHQADLKLRESEARYRNLFLNNQAVLLLIDPDDGAIVDANPAACTYYGYSADEITRLNISHINTLPIDQIRERLQSMKDAARRHFFFQHRLADGRVRDVEVFSGLIADNQRELIYSIVHDVTDRVRAEASLQQLNNTLEQQVAERTYLAETRAEQIKSLAAELIQAEENERERLARMLHNDLQQVIAAARLQLQSAIADFPQGREFSAVDAVLAEAVVKTRQLTQELMPPGLHNPLLAVCVENLVRKMEATFGLKVKLQLNSQQCIESLSLRRLIFRALQELLFNVIKHSGAMEASVTLDRHGDSLCLTVSDQGCGLRDHPSDDTIGSDGFGLPDLKQRTERMGGSLTVESESGSGCRIVLTVPLIEKKTAIIDSLRREAEAMLQRQKATPPPDAGGGMLRLLHEVEAQQIELEMQNEELRRTLKELERSHNRFKAFYDMAPVPIVTLSDKRLIQRFNEAAGRLFADNRHFDSGMAFSSFVADEDQGNYIEYVQRVTLGQAPTFCNLRLKNGGARTVRAHLHANPKRDAEGRVVQWLCFIIESDPNDRKSSDSR